MCQAIKKNLKVYTLRVSSILDFQHSFTNKKRYPINVTTLQQSSPYLICIIRVAKIKRKNEKKNFTPLNPNSSGVVDPFLKGRVW